MGVRGAGLTLRRGSLSVRCRACRARLASRAQPRTRSPIRASRPRPSRLFPPFTSRRARLRPGRADVRLAEGRRRPDHQERVLLPTPFIDLSAKVNTFDDRGFWGLAFDPELRHQRLRLHELHVRGGGNPNDGGPKTSRLTRVTANPTNPDVALAGSETVILGQHRHAAVQRPAAGRRLHRRRQRQPHASGRSFRCRRHAVVGVGDGADAALADPTTLRAQDLDQLERQDPPDQHGRHRAGGQPVLRRHELQPSKVWLYGVRNPFRFAVEPGTGEIWFGDVGWNTWEEVNHGVRARTSAGPASRAPAAHAYQSVRRGALALPTGAVKSPRDVRPRCRVRGDRRAVLHRHACTRSNTRETSSSPTTPATSSGGSCSTLSTTRSAPAFATDVPAPGVARTRA